MSVVGEILFPIRAQCPGCGSLVGNEAGFLCENCRKALVPVTETDAKLCPRCHTRLESDGTCSTCFFWPNARLTARYVYAYSGPAGGIVRAAKYAGAYRMLDWCSVQMIEKCGLENILPPDKIIPVPMYILKKRIRRYNQAEKLAEYLAKHMGYSADYKCLVRTRPTKAQAGLSGDARRTNLRGAFRCKEDLSGMNVWLVDDVRTTGATAVECADALFAAGAEKVLLLTFAGVTK